MTSATAADDARTFREALAMALARPQTVDVNNRQKLRSVWPLLHLCLGNAKRRVSGLPLNCLAAASSFSGGAQAAALSCCRTEHAGRLPTPVSSLLIVFRSRRQPALRSVIPLQLESSLATMKGAAAARPRRTASSCDPSVSTSDASLDPCTCLRQVSCS